MESNGMKLATRLHSKTNHGSSFINMKNLTYRELWCIINDFTTEQLDMTATVYDGEIDEYLPVRGIAKPDTDVLDSGHPVLIV